MTLWRMQRLWPRGHLDRCKSLGPMVTKLPLGRLENALREPRDVEDFRLQPPQGGSVLAMLTVSQGTMSQDAGREH